MKYGFVLPAGDARVAADFAFEAEQAGWDGFFMWEPVWGIDAWVSLTAAAMRTQRIRLGTMLTPMSRMRPWKLASETVTLDHLSNGRVILSVGLGAVDTGFAEFGEVTDRKTRAELLDEGLDILTGLWRGQPFSYEGKHYHIKPTQFFPPPTPVQQPRIPIWVVGAWRRETATRREKSMQRALRYDGLLPNVIGDDGQIRPMTPDDVKAMREYVVAHRHESTPVRHCGGRAHAGRRSSRRDLDRAAVDRRRRDVVDRSDVGRTRSTHRSRRRSTPHPARSAAR